MKSSQGDIFIDTVVDRSIPPTKKKTNKIKLLPCLTYIPKTGMRLPKKRGKFLLGSADVK